MRAPRIHAEAALAPHPRQVGAVEDLEHEAEAVLELALPLLEHRGRRGDHDGLRLLAQEQLAGDQAGLDRLAEASVVGNEEVHAREPERLAQRLHLVGVDLDAGAERRLEEVRVGGRDAVPAQGVQEGGELARRVEALGGEIRPALLLEDAPVELVVPEDASDCPWASSSAQARRTRAEAPAGRRLDDLFDEPAARADLDEFADFRMAYGKRLCCLLCDQWFVPPLVLDLVTVEVCQPRAHGGGVRRSDFLVDCQGHLPQGASSVWGVRAACMSFPNLPGGWLRRGGPRSHGR